MTDTSIHWAIYNRQNKVIIKINIYQFKVSDTGFMTADASEIWENNVTCQSLLAPSYVPQHEEDKLALLSADKEGQEKHLAHFLDNSQ